MKNTVIPRHSGAPPRKHKLVTYYLTAFDKRAQTQYAEGQDQKIQMQGLSGI